MLDKGQKVGDNLGRDSLDKRPKNIIVTNIVIISAFIIKNK